MKTQKHEDRQAGAKVIAWILANCRYDPAGFDGEGAVWFIASGVTMPWPDLLDIMRLFADRHD